MANGPVEDVHERIATGVTALVALTIAQMTRDPGSGPWTQQDLIIALHKGGLRPKDIATILGTSRLNVDPTLSRYRKSRERKRRPSAPTPEPEAPDVA